jgi:hypothetical protein
MDTLAARVVQIRPSYVGKASPAEIENFAAFIDSLAVLTRHVERLLDEPPRPPTADPSNSAVRRLTDHADPALVRYCLKVGLCTVVGYLIGVIGNRRSGFPSCYHYRFAQLRHASSLYACGLRGLLCVDILFSRQRADDIRGEANGHRFCASVRWLEPVYQYLRTSLAHWGTLLGDFAMAIVFFILWPEYGDSLLPRCKESLAIRSS